MFVAHPLGRRRAVLSTPELDALYARLVRGAPLGIAADRHLPLNGEGIGVLDPGAGRFAIAFLGPGHRHWLTVIDPSLDAGVPFAIPDIGGQPNALRHVAGRKKLHVLKVAHRNGGCSVLAARCDFRQFQAASNHARNFGVLNDSAICRSGGWFAAW